MNTINAAWTLAGKDLRSFVRDRTALVLSILVPIALVSVFGWIMAYAFGGSGGMPKVSLHVADLSQSSESARLLEKFKSVDMIRVRNITVEDGADEQKVASSLQKMIAEGDAHHIVVIPADYTEQLASGKTPEFEMIRDPGREMEDRIVRIAVMQATMAELNGTVWIDAMDRMLSEQGMAPEGLQQIRGWMTNIGEEISQLADSQLEQTEDSSGNQATANRSEDESAADGSTQEEVEEQSGGVDPADMFAFMSDFVPLKTTDIAPPDRAKQVTYQQAQSVAGMTVMMLLFALTSCGSVMLTEREEGTLKRLFVQPISRNAVLLGKFFFVFIVGICQMSILFLYGEWMFGVGLFRDPITLVILSLCWVAAGGAFGMFLASVSKSNKQAESLASLLILMMAALGGCWFPLQMMNLPALLDTVCKSTMTYWAMSGFQGMLWNQLPWYSSKTLLALGWQLGWALLLTVLATVFFRRNYCRG